MTDRIPEPRNTPARPPLTPDEWGLLERLERLIGTLVIGWLGAALALAVLCLVVVVDIVSDWA